MNQCLVCSKEFDPVNTRHRYCGNTCVARVYGIRKKIRAQLNEALKKLQVPSDLKEFDTSFKGFLGESL